MSRLAQPVTSADHSRGPDSAPVTLVEYGDFECPNCGEAYPILQELLRRLDGSVRFVYRNFPLSQSHPHAEEAAEAAEAAAAQGKFWQMHNLLFEHQDALTRHDLRRYAAEIGLDLARFDHEMAEHRYAEDVQEDFRSGVRSDVNGTPTFFINGERYDGPWNLGGLLAAIQQAEALSNS